MSEMTLSQLWQAIQSGRLPIPQGRHAGKTGQLRPLNGNLESVSREHSWPKEYVQYYELGKYTDLLRLLEKQQATSLHLILLKVLCLLHMAQSDELIGKTNPLEYLRDNTLPALKQVEHQDETGIVSERREWLERYCFGHDLPQTFWKKIGE